MSVLKSNRSESKAEFINTANEIYTRTITFLTRLSARYSRLLAADVARLASEVVDNAEKANSIFPSDSVRRELRERHLLEARASLMALDVKLSLCYQIMILNPAGCFETSSGKAVEKSDALKRLDKMAQALGDLIDKENTLLTGVLQRIYRDAPTEKSLLFFVRFRLCGGRAPPITIITTISAVCGRAVARTITIQTIRGRWRRISHSP